MLRKKVALVTGGARGIGLGISCRLVDAGFYLAINGRSAETDLAETLDELRQLGADVFYCQADVADARDRQKLIDATRKHFGRLDVLVNNAGVAPETRVDLLDATEESFDRVLSINLKGPYFLTQLVARWMVEQKRDDASFAGVIVNVSSVSATVASVNRGEYCISKAGVAMSTALWAARLGEFGIAVYEVRPGIVRTDMTAGVTEKYDKLIAQGLMIEPRWGVPDDVGRAVAVLARGDLSYATGNIIMVDGGATVPRL